MNHSAVETLVTRRNQYPPPGPEKPLNTLPHIGPSLAYTRQMLSPKNRLFRASLSSLISALLLVLPAHAKAHSSEFAEKAIYHGEPVSPGSEAWKSTVRLNFSRFSCSAVFIERDLILTAAHCTITNKTALAISLYKENSPDPTMLYFYGDEYLYRANAAYAKPLESEPGTDDIAIILLRKTQLPDGFVPAKIQELNITGLNAPSQEVKIIGAGITENHDLSEQLLQGEGRIAENMPGGIIRVDMKDSQGVCSGDSGGPVFIEKEGKLILTAIISAVSGNISQRCGKTLFATALTNKQYNWITSNARALRDSLK